MSEESSLSKIYNSMPKSMRTADDADVRHLVQLWKEENSPKAMEILVNSFIPLCIHHARNISHKYRLNKDAYDELEANLLNFLPKVIEKLDSERDNLSYTYINRSLGGRAQDFIKDYLGLKSEKQKYIFYHYGELRDHVLRDHSTPEHPVSTAKLHEEMAMLADAIKPKKYITSPIKAKDISEIAALRTKFFNGKVTEKIENIHFLGQAFHETDKNGKYNTDLIVKNTDQNFDLHNEYLSNPEENNIAYEEQAIAEDFMYKAGMALANEDPITWYIIKKNKLDDDLTTLVDLGKELGLTVTQVRTQLDKGLERLKEISSEEEHFKSRLEQHPKLIQQEDASRLPSYEGKYGSPLTTGLIIEGIDAHRNMFHHSPYPSDRRTIELDPLKGDSWRNIDYALTKGTRGLPQYEGGLNEFLEKHHRAHDKKYTKEDILYAQLLYRSKHHGEWPEQRTPEPVPLGSVLHGKSWASLDQSMSLYRIRREYESTYNKQDVKESIGLHIMTHKYPPSKKTPGKIDDGTKLSGYSWNIISTMKIDGMNLEEIALEYKAECEAKFTKQDVKESIKLYLEAHDYNAPATNITGKINDGTKLSTYSWNQVNKMKIDGMTLEEIALEYKAECEAKFTKQDVKESIKLYLEAHGTPPTARTPGKVGDGTKLSCYSWRGVDGLKIDGMSLLEIYKEYKLNLEQSESPNYSIRSTNEYNNPTLEL